MNTVNDASKSAIEFAKMWCGLFVGDNPDIKKAINYFDEKATMMVPGVPFRVNRDEDEEEIKFSHLVDGRGHVHYWQVIEPQVFEAGDMAVVTYYNRYNVGRKGESVVKCAKETLVLLRNEEKKDWKIVHMHNSAV